MRNQPLTFHLSSNFVPMRGATKVVENWLSANEEMAGADPREVLNVPGLSDTDFTGLELRPDVGCKRTVMIANWPFHVAISQKPGPALAPPVFRVIITPL